MALVTLLLFIRVYNMSQGLIGFRNVNGLQRSQRPRPSVNTVINYYSFLLILVSPLSWS